MIPYDRRTQTLLKNRQAWQNIPGFFLANQCQLLRDIIVSMDFPRDHVIVEIGSWLGRSTVCMAEVSPYKVVSIDPHNGKIQRVLEGEMQIATLSSKNADGELYPAKTYKPFLKNLEKTNTRNRVEVIKEFPEKIEWDGRKIALLHLDGIHDHEHLEIDMSCFAKYVVPKGFIAFHDYGAKFYPDVKEYVDSKVLGNGYIRWMNTKQLMVVQKQ